MTDVADSGFKSEDGHQGTGVICLLWFIPCISGVYLPLLTCCWSTFSLLSHLGCLLSPWCSAVDLKLQPVTLSPIWSYLVSLYRQLTWLKAEVLIRWHLWTSCVVFTPAYILTVIIKFLTLFLPMAASDRQGWGRFNPGWGVKRQRFSVRMIYMWLLTALLWKPPRSNVFMW